LNRVHNLMCSSGWWARRVENELIPWGISQTDLGDDVLEIGPGFGATTKVLARRPGRLSVLELDEGYCERLRRALGDSAEVIQGDATDMPYEDGRFSGVVCFTMLHHVPSAELQDRLLGEVARVLRPGGVFAGTDSVSTGLVFRAIHVGDTLMPVDPAGFAARLAATGLEGAKITPSGGSFRFRATMPD
jgi:ubiquinone/menaquinone biosynthesis C-methylase UbiE